MRRGLSGEEKGDSSSQSAAQTNVSVYLGRERGGVFTVESQERREGGKGNE